MMLFLFHTHRQGTRDTHSGSSCGFNRTNPSMHRQWQRTASVTPLVHKVSHPTLLTPNPQMAHHCSSFFIIATRLVNHCLRLSGVKPQTCV